MHGGAGVSGSPDPGAQAGLGHDQRVLQRVPLSGGIYWWGDIPGYILVYTSTQLII